VLFDHHAASLALTRQQNIDYHYIVAVGIFMVQVGEFYEDEGEEGKRDEKRRVNID
jgi:hypothetical protein